MFYVYVLKSLKDGNYYIGQTNNIESRIRLHFCGKVPSTKDRRPLKLVGYKTFKTRSESMWMEHKMKNHGDQKKKFIGSLFDERPPARSLRRVRRSIAPMERCYAPMARSGPQARWGCSLYIVYSICNSKPL